MAISRTFDLSQAQFWLHEIKTVTQGMRTGDIRFDCENFPPATVACVVTKNESVKMLLEQAAYTAEQHFINVEEGVLVQACLAGNEAAWAQLFKRYSRLIYKIPLSFGFPALEAEEIFQEIAMEIVECLATLQSHTHLHPWIVTIARRVCIRRLRSAKRYTTVDIELLESAIEDGVDSLDDMLIRLEEYSLIRNALAALEPKCRIMLTELFLKDPPMTHAAVAALLNLPLGSIGPTRARCLEKLREQVDLLSQTAAESQFDDKN